MNLLRVSRTLLAVCALCGFSTHGVKAQAFLGPSKEDIAETAAWFDSLEWPDVAGKPFVEVTCVSQYANGDIIEQPMGKGFLFGEDEKGFTIFCTSSSNRLSMNPLTFTRVRKPAAGCYYTLKHREIALNVAVDALVAQFRGLTTGDWIPGGISNHASAFVLARFCARVGRKDLAERLDAELLKIGGYPILPDAPPDHSKFRNGVEDEIAEPLVWHAIEEFCDMSVSRPELLGHFERIQRDFPVSRHHALVSNTVKMLQMMVAEDEAHRRTAKPIETMGAEEKAWELIFRLRDQHSGYHVSEEVGAAASPMEQLVKLGPVAVPALIETIGDKRFTRSINPSFNAAFESARTVGECVHEILWRISGRSLDREGAISWWKDFQINGGKAKLIEGVRAGEHDSYNQALRLTIFDPSACIDASIAGIRATKFDEVREWLVRAIAQIKSEEATAALRLEMRENQSLRGRVVAAAELFRRGAKDSAPVMIDEWQKWKSSSRADSDTFATVVEPLIVFLATCGDMSAMKALAERFSQQDAHVKFKILDIVIGLVAPESLRGVASEVPADLEKCGEEIGIAALTDKNIFVGLYIGRAPNPRVCDYAAIQFANRWPERYFFKFTDNESHRDMQIFEIDNIWRKSHGMEILPLPKNP